MTFFNLWNENVVTKSHKELEGKHCDADKISKRKLNKRQKSFWKFLLLYEIERKLKLTHLLKFIEVFEMKTWTFCNLLYAKEH